MGNVAYKLTPDDLISALKTHLGFLERSAWAFDSGFEDEALRMAGTLRALLHHTTSSSALLTQLGEQKRLRFLDTASPIEPGNLLATPGLIRFRGDSSGMQYEARLGDLLPGRMNRFKPFGAWWNDPVTKDTTGLTFARNDYVLKTANKEFAHVDPELDADWARLTRQDGLGFMGMGSPALASIRQIAYEVDQTLQDQLGDLLTVAS
jgi:hypothetical protein